MPFFASITTEYSILSHRNYLIIEMLLLGNIVSLQCLYCNGVFKDRSTLRDHMRKKQHKKLNPQDKRYDKFYVINYLVSSCDLV